MNVLNYFVFYHKMFYYFHYSFTLVYQGQAPKEQQSYMDEL